ncbi:unnamed protein product [Caenorhabditis auriculariae]|uniref:Uncharacterized protein n=1 Tax=Caenorhabditis auriculariae TaxID=2777116 RepID=A0A8S1HUL4_9PELO|nr:unnamed protein product [Caenorhabditis auriculariae]
MLKRCKQTGRRKEANFTTGAAGSGSSAMQIQGLNVVAHKHLYDGKVASGATESFKNSQFRISIDSFE